MEGPYTILHISALQFQTPALDFPASSKVARTSITHPVWSCNPVYSQFEAGQEDMR